LVDHTTLFNINRVRWAGCTGEDWSRQAFFPHWKGMDDNGNILIEWENGSTDALIPGSDKFTFEDKFIS